jgi:hypothetical protein
MMNSVVNANKALIEASKERSERKDGDAPVSAVTNNNLFVGSFSDALEAAQEIKKAKKNT